jgi:predicted amidohydrolase YtcJ
MPVADIVVYGGSVWGPDGPVPDATAVAVRAGVILAVGAEGDIRAREGRATVVVRVPGGAILPGVVDAHGHLHGLGFSMETLDLVGTRSAEEVAGKVREAAARVGPGEWIVGRGWDQNDWPVAAFPDRALLDAAAPHSPVYLRRVDGHAAWVNGAAFALAGIGASAPDPPGGRMLRRPDGSPSGVLVDKAMDLLVAVQPKPDGATIRRRVLGASERLASVGVTGLHDMGEPLDVVAVLSALDGERRLPLRVHLYLEGAEPATSAFLVDGPRPAAPGSLLSIIGVKYYLDGALGSRGAALLAPYADDPENSGLLLTEPERLAALAKGATMTGFQVAVHAIGDRANRIALETLGPLAMRALRPPRIEHAQIVAPEDLGRFGSEGVVASMQPTHCTSDSSWAGARLGPARERGAYAWRSIARAGGLLAFGSDVPVEDPDPRLGLAAAVTRGGWHPEEALSMVEAVRAFTDGAARAVGEGDRRGRIAPGLEADLTVFDRPIGTADEVRAAKAALTVVGGRIVYGG